MASVCPDNPRVDSDHSPEESAPSDWAEADNTGIDPPATIPSTRAARSSFVRIGRLAVPVGAIAWMLSILLHGTVALAACLLMRYFGPTMGGQPDGDSPGGSDVSLVSGKSPGPIVQSGLPENALAPDEAQPQLHKPESDDAPAEPSWSDHAIRTALESSDAATDGKDFLVIGVRGGSFMSPPAFHHAAGAPPAAADSASGGGGAPVGPGVSTYPGLPGELVGTGFPKPDYPLEARRRGEAGTVIVELEIRADGFIGQIRVLRDPGYPMLREAALAAAAKLRGHHFAPATRDGRPIEYLAPIRYEFSLR